MRTHLHTQMPAFLSVYIEGGTVDMNVFGKGWGKSPDSGRKTAGNAGDCGILGMAPPQ